MDIRDHKGGATESFFWFEKKKNLFEILIGKVVKPGSKIKILDIGSGTGVNIPALKKFGDIYAVDNNEEALRLIANDIIREKRLGDATRIPYPDNFFEIVVASDILEHVKDDNSAVREINRVLKSGGFLVFTVPAFNFLFSAHDKAVNHFRRYNKKVIRKLLSDLLEFRIGFWVFLLFFPVAIFKLLNRKKRPQIQPYSSVPKFINKFAGLLIDLENWLIKNGISLPLGINIYGIFQKKF